MDPTHYRHAELPPAEREIERWLSTRLAANRTEDTQGPDLALLAGHAGHERMRLLGKVLGRNPSLQSAARRLALIDQLRITLELVRGGPQLPTSPAWATGVVAAARVRTRCSRTHRGRPR